MEIVGTSSSDQQIMDRSDEVSLDINEIATSLRDQLKTKKVFSRACCIYRVPETLRELNEKAFAPRVVSIGPIHHGKENLKAIEDHKITYLYQFLEESEVSVEDLLNVVKDNETKLRDCYAETIDLSREDFATMILLDAVFVIIVLLKWNEEGDRHESGSADQIFFRPWKLDDVLWDMSLLENQLPFFILEELLERYSAAGASPRNRTVIELTSLFSQKITGEPVKEDSPEVLHFVDVIRNCLQPTGPRSEERKNPLDVILSAPTATELHQSGVKFKEFQSINGSKSVLDVRFRDGILEIPQLRIHGRTETLFRNLQAFEQCHSMYEDKFVSDYMSFFSCLVRAPNDVKVLVQHASLKNMLTSDEAASNLINKIHKEDYLSTRGFLIGICEDLNSHCRKHRHKWKATLKQVYFNNPWTAISVAAAAFLLILTVIQTVCSILQKA